MGISSGTLLSILAEVSVEQDQVPLVSSQMHCCITSNIIYTSHSHSQNPTSCMDQ